MPDNDSSPNNSQAPSDDTFALLSDAERAAIWQDLLDHPPPRHPSHGPVKKLTAAQRRFNDDYWKIAGPKLLALVVGYAPMVRLEVYGFSEAWEAIWRAAVVYGAQHLSEEALAELDSWISRELLARIDDDLPEGLVTPARLARITGER